MTTPRRLTPAWIAAACTLAFTLAVSVRAQDASPQDGSRGGYGQRGQGRMGMGRGIRGTVTAVSGMNVTLKTDTGETWTVVTTDNTRVNIDRQPVKVTDIKPGDEVMAVGIRDQEKHELHAMMLGGASAAAVAKLKADMGKTYIVGRVTAIDDTKLTLERPDHVSQTITLDESTSIKRGGRLPPELLTGGGVFGGGRRGYANRENGNPAPSTNNENSGGMPQGMEGEAITLADIKVGDNVAGTGSMKNGVFVPTDLHVLVRPQRGPRPNSNGPQNSATPGSQPAPPSK